MFQLSVGSLCKIIEDLLYYSFMIFFILISCFFTFLWTLTPFIHPLMDGDSLGYLHFSQHRTIGYPAFLWCVKKLFGKVDYVFWIQPFLMSCAHGYFAKKLRDLHVSFWLCVLVLFAFSMNFNIPRNSFSIMTESLHLTCLVMVFAQSFSIYHNNKGYGSLGFWIGLAILIRPVNYVLFSILVFILLMKRPSFKKIFQTSASFLCLWFLGGVSHKIAHGFFGTESFLGHNLFGKVVFCTSPKTSDPILKNLHNMAAPYKKNSENVQSFYTQYQLKAPYYDYIRYKHLNGIFEHKPSDQEMKTKAIKMITEHPLKYIYDVCLNYFAIWQMADLSANLENKQYQSFYEKAQKLVQDDSSFIEYIKKRTAVTSWKTLRVVYTIRILLALVWLSTFFLIFWAFKNRRQQSLWTYLGGLAAISIQSHHGVIALLQAGLPRYLFAQWPSLILCVISCLMIMKYIFFQQNR